MSKFRKPKNWWVPASGHLTKNQATALADVITEWAILEVQLQDLLCVLIQSPHTLGQAVTEDLGPDNRLKAVKRLARSWLAWLGSWETYPDRDILLSGLSRSQEIATWVATTKERRNRIVHWTWFRVDNETIFGAKYRTTPVEAYPPNALPPEGVETIAGLNTFSQEINEISREISTLNDVLAMLPAWPDRPPEGKPALGLTDRIIRPMRKTPPPALQE